LTQGLDLSPARSHQLPTIKSVPLATKAPSPKQLRFCEALSELSESRPRGWWASIDSVAKRVGIDSDNAVQLALDCEWAGLVRHDLSRHSEQRGETDLPQ
jgi:hypothetical protein